jgi:hypothetical protein
MRTTAISGATLLALSLAGCNALVFPGAGNGCITSNGVCKVDIAVPPGCTTGQCVVLGPDPVHVGDGSGKATDVNLLWQLPSGYAFCGDDSVEFAGDTRQQFSDNYATNDPQGARDHTSGARKNYHWKDANTYKGPFKYTIHFHDFHDGACNTAFEKDPGVINEM